MELEIVMRSRVSIILMKKKITNQKLNVPFHKYNKQF